jgi:hypothetical protein
MSEVQMNETKVEKLQKLVPTETDEIGNNPEDKHAQLNKLLKERLQIISCECGAEILLVPDLQAMNRAIKAHVAEHIKKGKNAQGNISTSGKISQLLSQLTLIKMSKINGTSALDT